MAGPTNRRRRRRAKTDFKEDKIYLEGVVTDTLPGVRFVVKVERPNGLEPLEMECNTKTLFKLKKIKIIKGDTVVVELDPVDLSTGTIVERK